MNILLKCLITGEYAFNFTNFVLLRQNQNSYIKYKLLIIPIDTITPLANKNGIKDALYLGKFVFYDTEKMNLIKIYSD